MRQDFFVHWDHIVPRSSLKSAQVSQIIDTFKTHSENTAFSKLAKTKQWSCSPSTPYRWRKRFSKHLIEIRSTLYLKKPPAKGQYTSSPEDVTLKHLQDVFPKASCLVAAFQSTFQRVFGQVNSTRFPRCHRVIQTALNLFRAATRDENQWPFFETRVSPIPGPNEPKNYFW